MCNEKTINVLWGVNVTMTVPVIRYAAEKSDRMVKHLEKQAAVREVAAAVTRWYYTSQEPSN